MLQKRVMRMILSEDFVFSHLPERAPDSHKGNYGKLLAVCGSSRYRGAAVLATLGALRTGVGLYTLAAPEYVVAAVAAHAAEAMYLPLPNKSLPLEMEKNTVCLIGCGLPDTADTAAIVRAGLNRAQALVIDAGGLSAISHDPELLIRTACPVVITPHPGEMARLCGETVAQITSHPAETALAFSRRTGTVVVLKGHRTFIAGPDGTLLENHTGNAGLARGGSGDLLAGMISSLWAQGLSPVDAAACGVWLHGSAADRCARRLSMQGMLPEDILQDLCAIFLENETHI